MSTQHTRQSSSNSMLEDHADPASSADGQTARQAANRSEEPSIDHAREAFDRNDTGREGTTYDRLIRPSSTKSESSRDSRWQKFPGRDGRGSNSSTTSTGLILLCGVTLGAALMYILDPGQGRRRRTLLSDKLVGATNKASDVIGKTSRDLRNRAQGVLHDAGSMFTSGENSASDLAAHNSQAGTEDNTRARAVGQGS